MKKETDKNKINVLENKKNDYVDKIHLIDKSFCRDLIPDSATSNINKTTDGIQLLPWINLPTINLPSGRSNLSLTTNQRARGLENSDEVNPVATEIIKDSYDKIKQMEQIKKVVEEKNDEQGKAIIDNEISNHLTKIQHVVDINNKTNAIKSCNDEQEIKDLAEDINKKAVAVKSITLSEKIKEKYVEENDKNVASLLSTEALKKKKLNVK